MWPGCGKPASCTADFWIGFVTMPAASPLRQSATAVSIEPTTAPAVFEVGTPSASGTRSPIGSTGRARGKTVAASAARPIVSIGTRQPT